MQWSQFNLVYRRQQLMDQMMQRVGADVLTAVRLDQGDAFVTARAKCRQCVHEIECRKWLESAGALPLPPDFCPNGSFFRRCA